MVSETDTGTKPSELPGREELLASGRAIEAETDIGVTLLERDAELVTPAVIQYGCWAPEMSELMRRYLRRGMTFADAGANIGYLSSLASQLVGPEGRVFSVEVDPANLPLLHANLAQLGERNATVIPFAAWHEEAELDLLPSRAGGAGTGVAEGVATGSGKVLGRPLGEMVDADVDFLKVDCEMTDHLVVKGARKLIERNPDMLITVEYHPATTGYSGYSPAEVLALYRDLGLKPYEISPEGDLTATSYEAITAGGAGAKEGDLYDIALCAGTPGKLRRRRRKASEGGYKGAVLRTGGNLLEYLPERIRPKIRHRDRTG
jgi:FkbM family methyltransferase